MQVNPKLKNLSDIDLWKLFINKLYFYERFKIEDELKRIFSGKNQQLIYIIKQIIENSTIEFERLSWIIRFITILSQKSYLYLCK